MKNARGGDPNLTRVTSEIKLKNLQLGLLMGRRSSNAMTPVTQSLDASREDTSSATGGSRLSVRRSQERSRRGSQQGSRRSSRASIYSWREGLTPRSKSIGRVYQKKIGRWNPGDLAKKIKEKHDIDRLIHDKVILKNPAVHFEMIQGQSRLSLPKQDEYLKNNPIEVDGLGYKNTSYFKLMTLEREQRRRKQLAEAGRVMQSLEKFPKEQQRRSLISMRKFDLSH